MRGVLRFSFIARVVGAPAAGYQKLITLFKDLKEEADGTHKIDSGLLADHSEKCATELDDLTSKIASTTEKKDGHVKKEEAAKVAVAGAEKDLSDEKAQKENADGGLAALEASYTKNDARMKYDLEQLQAAVGGLDTAVAKAAGHPGLTEAKKSKLKSMIGNLKGKMSQDMMRLEKDKSNGVAFYAENKKSMEDKISAHIAMIGEIGGRLANQKGILTQETASKVEAESALNKLQAAKREKKQACDEGTAALEASIKDASERSAALDSALQILGESSSSPIKEPMLIQEMSLKVSHPIGFLQLPPRQESQKSLMRLLNRMGDKNREVSNLLRSALQASPSQVGAFKQINSEIEKLLNDMHQQQQDDEKSRSWCQQKDNELTLQIEDAQKKLTETTTKLEGLNAKAEMHNGNVEDAKKTINALLQDSVKDHEGLMKDLDENKVELEQLHKDLSNLEQAKITLSNKFAGRTESAGAIVMEEVDKVIVDYNTAITTNEAGRRQLDAAVESTEKEYGSRLAQERANQKKNANQLERTSGKALSTEDLKRTVNTQLKTLQKTFDGIFKANDGKCLNYNAMFGARKEARGAEMNNLNDAKAALAAYCESIGIRI